VHQQPYYDNNNTEFGQAVHTHVFLLSSSIIW